MPPFRYVVGQIEQAQNFVDDVIYLRVQIGRRVVKGHDGRHNDGSAIGKLLHVAQVNSAEGHFARHEQQLAAFLNANVRRPEQEVFAVARRDTRQSLHDE